jgi:hypothetical protein
MGVQPYRASARLISAMMNVGGGDHFPIRVLPPPYPPPPPPPLRIAISHQARPAFGLLGHKLHTSWAEGRSLNSSTTVEDTGFDPRVNDPRITLGSHSRSSDRQKCRHCTGFRKLVAGMNTILTVLFNYCFYLSTNTTTGRAYITV